MENTPDQTAGSDAEQENSFKRSIWWKIYFFFVAIMSSIGMAGIIFSAGAGFSEYIYLPMSVVATVGFFGFVFLKPVYKPELWLKIFVVYLAYTVIYPFITEIDQRMGMSDMVYYINTAVGWLISIPAYYALYAYSKASDPAWKRT